MNLSNLLDLSYEEAATGFRKLPYPIIDVHAHINGATATAMYAEAAALYGVGATVSMTQLGDIPTVRGVLRDRIYFNAIPNFGGQDRFYEFGRGFTDRLDGFFSAGARIAKFWTAPRIYDGGPENFADSPFRLDAPMRREAIERAIDLGMMLMVHVADPDTWFATKYVDKKKYGTKEDQYGPLEELLSRVQVPVIAAHMGGYPENLEFLSGLLTRNANLYLDVSAAKWIVRELSKHPAETVRSFFSTWKGRLLFGSDIVTTDAHLSTEQNQSEMAAKAGSHSEAFDLYASRYWVLRTLFETDYEGPSPVADPDLHLVDPTKFAPDAAPMLRGKSLSDDCLRELYHDAAVRLLGDKLPGLRSLTKTS